MAKTPPPTNEAEVTPKINVEAGVDLVSDVGVATNSLPPTVDTNIPSTLTTPESFGRQERLPSDLLESLQSYEQEVLQAANLIRDWMENARSKAVDAPIGSIGTMPERTPAIRDALARLSLKENNLNLLQKIAGITLPLELPNAATFDAGINNFSAR